MKNILSTLIFSLLVSMSFSGLQAQYIVESGRQVHKFHNTNGKSSLEVQYKGDVSISDDDRSILDISNNGFLYIKKKAFGNQRSIEITKRGGRLEYEYKVGGRKGSESEGKSWLSDVLLEVVRRSSIGAESRVARFMRRGGVPALMRELEEFESSSAKRVYFDFLLTDYDLNVRELDDVLDGINTISSSSSKGSLFREHYTHFMREDRLATHFFETVGAISSSSERGSIIRALLKEQRLSTSKQIACLEATGKISSDSEKGSVLRMMVKEDLISDRQVANAFFETLNGISSSSEKGSVLRSLLDQRQGWTEATTVSFFDSVSKISSSSEKGSILRKGAFLVQSPETMRPYFASLNSISSTSEKGSSIRSLLNTHKRNLNKSAFLEIFRTVKNLSSSSEQGSVLRLASQYMDQNDREITQGFQDAAESISSDSEYRSVIRTLKENEY